ncbi:MAG TPA: neutral/alkaline non-lysosomal ceramidase N-terminal domain-containing protein [Terriglobia bacterium]|nr:neutral/alkaline non-lysosomal ceramidase N-terminal domain-containing protein [Terriglobia bacterium]
MSKKGMLWLVTVLAYSLCWGATARGQATLRAGAARVDITPPVDPANPPSGKYAHERLYVRAIVLDNGTTKAALIGADQGGLPEGVWEAAAKQIAAELSCPVEDIVMSATHTHSAWGPGGFPGMRALRAEAGANQPPPPIVAQILDAVRQAKARLQPARVGYGTGKSYLNVNRDAVDAESHLWTQAPNLEGPSDKTVAVIEFLGATGEPIAVYMDYAMHPVNGFLAGLTSADFAGAASRYVEQAFGDKTVAVFVQGASGDQNPLYLRAGTNVLASRSRAPITGYVLTREPVEAPIRDGKVKAAPPDPKVVDALEHVMDSEGTLLGEEVIRVMTNINRLEASPNITAAQKTVTCPGRKRTDTAREGTPGTYENGDPVEIRLGVMRIGNIALASVDAELYSPIGQRLKRESPVANTLMVTLANGMANSGYIPNDTAFGALTFQVLGSRLKPGCAEGAIVNGLLDLIEATGR